MLVLTIVLYVYTVSFSFGRQELRRRCHKTILDKATLTTSSKYIEIEKGVPLLLVCRLCKYKHSKTKVVWSKDGIPIIPSPSQHYYEGPGGVNHYLKVRTPTIIDVESVLGNYTCLVTNLQDNQIEDSKTIIVDKLPPPPTFCNEPDGVNKTSQIISWNGDSKLPVIHFLLEFRLSPMSGNGEDWVSLVVPYKHSTQCQSYLLRGLSPGTSYQAKVRTKTWAGISYFSPLLQFTTFSSWTTSEPITTRILATEKPSSNLNNYKYSFAHSRLSNKGINISYGVQCFILSLLTSAMA